MPRALRHKYRRLSPKQRGFILSRVNGNVLEDDVLENLSRLFKKRFGVRIHPEVVRCLLRERDDSRGGHLDRRKSLKVVRPVHRMH